MPSITQCGNGSSMIAAALMRRTTWLSTSEYMFRHASKWARGARRRRDLRRVPSETKRLEESAHRDMLGETRIDLDQHRSHAPFAQGLLHAANDLVLEAVHVDLHEIGCRDLAARDELVEAQCDRPLGERRGARLEIETDLLPEAVAGTAGDRRRKVESINRRRVGKCST